MHVHAKKGITGSYNVVKDNEEEYTHWILDKARYKELRGYEDKVPELEAEIEKNKKKIASLNAQLTKSKQEQEASQTAYNSMMQALEDEKKKVNAAWKTVQENKRDIAETIEVARERANKERGLSNKKNNPGYRIISTEWYFQNNKKHGRYVWKTIMETPFFGTYDYGTFKKLWDNDKKRIELFEELDVGYFELDIDINSMDFMENNDAFCYRMEEKRIPDKFWQVTLYHTKELIL